MHLNSRRKQISELVRDRTRANSRPIVRAISWANNAGRKSPGAKLNLCDFKVTYKSHVRQSNNRIIRVVDTCSVRRPPLSS